ncbi:HNH endonuclease, partial [bacterium]|nr:HNH endonuclease [bacterium]
DNRLSNLREASQYCQSQNTNLRTDNPSGYKNISWYPKEKKYRVQLQINDKRMHLGYFTDITEAINVRDSKRNELKVCTNV